MSLSERVNFESVADVLRKPVVTLAAIAVLAAGVALETPAVADAQPAPNPDAPAKLSPQEQGSHDSELLPSLAVGGFMVAGCAGGLYAVARTMRGLE